MKAPVFLALAALAVAPPLAAQSAAAFLAGETAGDFRDPTIVQLVDAADPLRDPVPGHLPARGAAPDASRCDTDSLLFCELNPLAPGERFCPPPTAATAEVPEPETRGSAPEAEPVAAAPGPVVACSDSATGSVVAAWQPARAAAAPVPAEQVPEPSAILLIVGAAAWILLRRKY